VIFSPAKDFCWSPKSREIMFNTEALASRTGSWSLLHEVGHALLEHRSYQSDLELLQLEAAAWQKAREVGKSYGYEIDEQHIEDCLDTYRDWLHQRSACPRCNNRSFQQSSHQYSCYNCGTTWSVSLSRFCRPYRMTRKTKTSPSNSKATFA
jgi:hypothetical protein